MTNKDEFSAVNLSSEELKKLGARICLRRIKLGLSQRDLVNETYYERLLSDVESGQVAPTNEFLAYLADCLNTTPQELRGIAPAGGLAVRQGLDDPRVDAQQLALMNAHVNIETEKPGAALFFLEPYTGKEEEFPPDLKPVFYRLRGHANLLKKNWPEAEADLTTAFKLLDEAGAVNVLQREIVRNLIGLVYYRQNRLPEALKTHRDCLEAVIENKIINRRFRLMLYSNLANEYFLLNKLELALNIYKNDALPLAEQGEDDLQVGLIYWGAGMAYRARDDFGQAVLYLDRSVKIYRKYKVDTMLVQVQDQLGLTFIERGDYKLAEETLFNALTLAQTLNEPRPLALVNANIAYLYQKSGYPEKARQYIEASIKIERELGDKLLLGQGLATLADIKLALGAAETAFADYEEAVSLLEQTGHKIFIQMTLENYAEALKRQGQFDKALEILIRMSNLA